MKGTLAMEPLLVSLRKLRRRLALQQVIQLNAAGLLVAASLACLWLVATRLFPVLGSPWPVAISLLAIACIGATAWALSRRPTLVRAALEADNRLGLKERLTSSLELAEREGPMVDAVHEDARAHVSRLNPRRDFPLAAPRMLRWLAVPLLVFGVAYVFLPEFDLFGFQERAIQAKQREDAVKVVAQSLKEAVKPLKKETGDRDLDDIAAAVERIAENLERGEINEKQALARLTKVGEQIKQQRDALMSDAPTPKLADPSSQLNISKDLANAMQEGQFGEAAREMRKLQEKLNSGNMDAKTQEKLSKELQDMAEKLGGDSSQLGEALQKMAENMAKASTMEGNPNAAQAMNMSMEDLASMLEQLQQLDLASAQLAQMQAQMLGPSQNCRTCGTKLSACDGLGDCSGHGAGFSCAGVCGQCGAGKGNIGGWWGQGASDKEGSGGMGGPGRGRGGHIGELPDVNAGYKPTILPGDMTQGKILASVLQKGAPEEDAEPTVDYIAGAFEEVIQEAEEALTKEEIPAGSKELVRAWFGSLEDDVEATLDAAR
jgi:hypothetical protein